jgi:hypothetical protein
MKILNKNAIGSQNAEQLINYYQTASDRGRRVMATSPAMSGRAGGISICSDFIFIRQLFFFQSIIFFIPFFPIVFEFAFRHVLIIIVAADRNYRSSAMVITTFVDKRHGHLDN